VTIVPKSGFALPSLACTDNNRPIANGAL